MFCVERPCEYPYYNTSIMQAAKTYKFLCHSGSLESPKEGARARCGLAHKKANVLQEFRYHRNVFALDSRLLIAPIARVAFLTPYTVRPVSYIINEAMQIACN
uniref:Uncharacterized protein n=1 Tax=Glossina pallidipes TaxID=7398 RepID=A0A1A9ZX55_GLOPL